MKPFSYIAFLFLLMLGEIALLPSTARAEDRDAYRIQESVRPRRVYRTRKFRPQNRDGNVKRTYRRRSTRRGRRRAPRRQLASYRNGNENYYETERYKRSEKDEAEAWLARIGLLGGISTSSSIATDGFNKNLYLGLRGDLQYSYIGAEFDVYYGMGGKQESETATFLGDPIVESRGMSNIGADISLKAQLPVRLGDSARLVPKIGAGYTRMGQTISVAAAGNAITTMAVQGLHALVGFDLYPASKFLVSADFALGLLGNASTTVEDGSGSQSSSGAASFNRLRLGGYYEIASHFLLGAQFTRRSFTIDSSFGDNQNQMLGVLMYSF